jgi:hypothetical protein
MGPNDANRNGRDRWGIRSPGLVCWAASLLCACGVDDDGAGAGAGGEVLLVAASLDEAPAEPSEITVVWNVSSGSPDYVYAWGRARLDDEHFTVRLDGPPPAEALNSYGLGVGAIVLAPTDDPLPEGRLDDDVGERITGISPRHAIIYADHERFHAAVDELAERLTPDELQEARDHWLLDFPPGYSCGEGRDAEPGETFDTYVPVDCREVWLHQGDLSEVDGVNWT